MIEQMFINYSSLPLDLFILTTIGVYVGFLASLSIFFKNSH